MSFFVPKLLYSGFGTVFFPLKSVVDFSRGQLIFKETPL